MRYGELAGPLHDQGLALHNLARCPTSRSPGRWRPGTHGSGDGNGSLATAVRAMQMVTRRRRARLAGPRPRRRRSTAPRGARRARRGHAADARRGAAFEVRQSSTRTPLRRLVDAFAESWRARTASASSPTGASRCAPRSGSSGASVTTRAAPPDAGSAPGWPTAAAPDRRDATGELHPAAGRAGSVARAAPALPAGLHAQQRRGAAVGVLRARAAPPSGGRCAAVAACATGGTGLQTGDPHDRGRRPLAEPATDGTASRCTSPGSLTGGLWRRSSPRSRRRWPPSMRGRTGARCSAPRRDVAARYERGGLQALPGVRPRRRLHNDLLEDYFRGVARAPRWLGRRASPAVLLAVEPLVGPAEAVIQALVALPARDPGRPGNGLVARRRSSATSACSGVVAGRRSTNSSPPWRPRRSQARRAFHRPARPAACGRRRLPGPVVDRLEAVEVQHHHRQRRPGPGGQGVLTLGGGAESRPVQQPGQLVGVRLLPHPRHHVAQHGDGRPRVPDDDDVGLAPIRVGR